MLRLENLSLSRGGRPLLRNVNISLNPGECAALVGRNGTGKSTLLAAISGELSLDQGKIHAPIAQHIVHLEQVLPRSSLSSVEYVIQGDRQLMEARRAQQQAESANDGQSLAHALLALDEAQNWSADARARQLLNGLGFSQLQCEQSVDALSGGWRMRLNLARVLFAPGQMLLLDEPTNHLDLDAIIWLQQWLKAYQGSVLLVSHDREFIDAVADVVWHLEHQSLTRYSGGYSQFEEQSAERLAQQERAISIQEERIAQLTRFVERFRAKATKAKQAQSRLKMLERMVKIQRFGSVPQTRFQFELSSEGPDPILTTDQLCCGYGQTAILSNIKLAIRKGERIGVLGRNGAGKSTLIKTLVGELVPMSGEIQKSRVAQVGYFAQGAIESLDPKANALQHMRRIAPDRSPQELLDYLAPWGFRGELASDLIEPFSGGEKARLALAMLAWHRPHVLVMDEPTNHLDSQAREALALSLAQYEGALLLVSHDRALLRSTVDRLILVADGTVTDYEGDLDEYTLWLAKKPVDQASQAGGPTHQATVETNRKDERRVAAQERERLGKLRKPLEARLNRVNQQLTQLQTEITQLELQLASSQTYEDAQVAAKLTRQHGEAKNRLAGLENEWLQISEQLEAIK